MKIVSVIIPIYNVDTYLDECVKSVCNQTYSDLEIILVDDGSTDSSPKKCDEWAQKDPRITVIHKDNGGLSSARNAGLDIATGDYVYFLDGDDYVDDDLIENVISVFSDDIDLVSFRYRCVHSDGKKQEVQYQVLGDFDLATDLQKWNFLCEHVFKGKIAWEAWGRVFRRDLIENNHLRFADNRLIFAEDLYFYLCCLVHARKMINTAYCLYNYRVRENSIMGVNSGKTNLGRFDALGKAVLQYYQEHCPDSILVLRFSIVYFWLINMSLRPLWNQAVKLEQLRSHFKSEITDSQFMKLQLRSLQKYKKALYDIYVGNCPGAAIEERIEILRYCCGGSYLRLQMRNRWIYRHKAYYDSKAPTLKRIEQEYQSFVKKAHKPPSFYLIGTEEFGNVGDHKIAEAINEFFLKMGLESRLKEITIREYPLHKTFLKKYIKPYDVIILTGGGNFGDAYLSAHRLREDVILTWKQNTKIIFPQTIFFTESEKGEEALKKSQQVYVAGNNIVLFVREKPSYEFAKQLYTCCVKLVPDIVLSVNESSTIQRNNQIVVCLRTDEEKQLRVEDEKNIAELVNNSGCAATLMDLQLPYHVDRQNRKTIIEDRLNVWRASRMVITDRLHGMVFAAITGTPCIAFGNYNHKVKGTYEWIKYLPYIRYVESVEEAKQVFPELLEMKDCQYDNTPLQPYFDQIKEVVKQYA